MTFRYRKINIFPVFSVLVWAFKHSMIDINVDNAVILSWPPKLGNYDIGYLLNNHVQLRTYKSRTLL